DGLADDPEMAGRVDFHFRVAGDGHVAMVKITDSGLEDKPTEDCLVQSARRWQFPETGNKQLVKFDTDFEFACE
ncbi:MAG: AgmX/PglI C-terminal domain-containing protein, partial [Myxococcota bacterium]